MPDSTISLRLTSTSRQFAFFSLVFNLYDLLLQNGVFRSPMDNANVYRQMQYMFMDAKTERIMRISLSETHINILAGCVAALLRAITENNFNTQFMHTLPLLMEVIDDKFLKNAREIFGKHSERFKHVPEFRKTLDLLST